jgi:hypothetical protein
MPFPQPCSVSIFRLLIVIDHAQVGVLAAQLEQYEKAIQVFEEVATAYVCIDVL